MGYDEILNQQALRFSGLFTRVLQTWRDALNAARTGSPYTLDQWFAESQKLGVAWWDAMLPAEFPGQPVLPTVTIAGPLGGMNGWNGSAIVAARLTNYTFQGTRLAAFDGGGAIPATSYAIGISGAFDGVLQVTVTANPPAVGVYRGLVLGKAPGANEFSPLAWVVVIAR